MADLYGTKDPSKTKHKPISSTTSLAFSSTLSSLISTTKSKSNTAQPRPRPSKPSSSSSSSIFTTHNKNVKKRSLADMQDDQPQPQPHKTKHDIGPISTSDLHRSKRKMEEKVRLYNAMKRGEYIGREDSQGQGQGGGLVDFDRKWADSHARGSRDSASEQGSDDDDDDSNSESGLDSTTNDGPKTVEYLDEFGRLRHGTPHAARRAAQTQHISRLAHDTLAESAAHPQRPSNLIYGDTIQHAAFNPDHIVTAQMEALAKKRDKSPTPPPDTHYDASGEIRNRGTGFYAFSRDSELRKGEMEGLERERGETERVRGEREKGDGREKRKREVEERRRLIAEKRSQREAERFLEGLDVDLKGEVVEGGDGDGIETGMGKGV